MNIKTQSDWEKITPGIIQDLFHYSLALKGENNGHDANSLRRRIECGESASRLLSSLEAQTDFAFFEAVIPRPESWNQEADMVLAGQALGNRVVEWAQFHGIDPSTGAVTIIHCSVCGSPAMTHQTQCFRHFFGHNIGE